MSIKVYCEDNYTGLKFLRSYALCYDLTGLYNNCTSALWLVDHKECLAAYLKVFDSDAVDYFRNRAATAISRLIDDYGMSLGCIPSLSPHYSVTSFVKEISQLL